MRTRAKTEKWKCILMRVVVFLFECPISFSFSDIYFFIDHSSLIWLIMQQNSLNHLKTEYLALFLQPPAKMLGFRLQRKLIPHSETKAFSECGAKTWLQVVVANLERCQWGLVAFLSEHDSVFTLKEEHKNGTFQFRKCSISQASLIITFLELINCRHFALFI